MSKTKFICMAALVLAAWSSAGQADQKGRGKDLDEVVVADELRSAFYERAPASLASKLSKAVREWCSTGARTPQAGSSRNDKKSAWVCKQNELGFYRSVYPNGARGPHGLVCKEKAPRYLGERFVDDLIRTGNCIAAEPSETNLYYLDVDREIYPEPCEPEA